MGILDENSILEYYMKHCINLADSALPHIKKPHVGAVVLSKEGSLVGEGYKSCIDGCTLSLHAERMALGQARDKSVGGYLFTTLEPCFTKPGVTNIFKSCSELIVQHRVKYVIIGKCFYRESDPNSGIPYLMEKGIEVHYLNTARKDIIDPLSRLAQIDDSSIHISKVLSQIRKER
jgi:pyrimidine deaminase RibD-like protein